MREVFFLTNSANHGILSVDYSGDAELKAPISGSGDLYQIGTGNLTIDQDLRAFHGAINVKSGTFTLGPNANFYGVLTNYSNTTLAGGSVIYNGVDPGGHIDNYGSLRTESGPEYMAEISSLNNYGSATLNDTSIDEYLVNKYDKNGISSPTITLFRSRVKGITSVDSGVMQSDKSQFSNDVTINNGAKGVFSNTKFSSDVTINRGAEGIFFNKSIIFNKSSTSDNFVSNNGTMKLENSSVTSSYLTNNGTMEFDNSSILPKRRFANLGLLISNKSKLNGIYNTASATAILDGGSVQGDVDNLGILVSNASKLSNLSNEKNATAILNGGRVQGAVDNSGALTIAGTVAIGGAFTMETGSSLLFANLFSRANVADAATLNMDVISNPYALTVADLSNARIGQVYTVLSATKGVTGTTLETSLNKRLTTYDPRFALELHSVGGDDGEVDLDLKLLRASNGFLNTVADGSHNVRATAHALDVMAASSNPNVSGSGLIDALTYQVARNDMKRVMNNLSGEIHASVRTALIQDSFMMRNAVLNRLDNSDCAFGRNGQSTYDMKTHRKNDSCASDHVMLWGQAYGSLGSNSATGEAAAMHHNTAGFVMGLDAPIHGTNWRAGGLVSYGHSMFNIGDGRSSSGNSNNITVGGYAGTHWGRLNLRLGVTYSWNAINTRRQIAVGSYGGRVNSSYLGGTAQGFAELGYKMHAGRTVFEPFANVAYVNMQTNAYRERGNDAALRGRGQDNGVTFSSFGFRAATRLKVGKMRFAPHLSGAYRHAFGVTGGKVHQSFVAGGADATGFGINGVLLSDNAAVVETGVTAPLTQGIDLDLSYIGQYGNRSVDSGATGSFRMAF